MSFTDPSTRSVVTWRSSLRDSFGDWARTSGRNWIYLVKLLCAVFLALWISMRFDMSSPSMAMTTVFIVMNPQSGPVFAKSFYRLCGTLVGLIVSLTLIGLFAQMRELFLASLVMWVAFSTAGAAARRGFQSYSFVLAGYTVAIIGLPASQQPHDAFMTVMTRVSEVSVGILAAAAASALLFPRYRSEQMQAALRQRLSGFIGHMSAVLLSNDVRAQIERTHSRFMSDIVGFEASRNIALFEGPPARLRTGRHARLNSEFMVALSRFHMLHNQLARFASHPDQARAATEIERYTVELGPLSTSNGKTSYSPDEADSVAERLLAYRQSLPVRLRATREEALSIPNFPLVEFDVASDLLLRFVADLHEYIATYASLASDRHIREQWSERYQPRTDPIAGIVAGTRALVATALVAVFWIVSGWPSGISMVAMTAVFCALASTFPRPTEAVIQMLTGALVAVPLGMLLMFWVYPNIDGFPLLCVALGYFIAPGVWLTVSPRRAPMGAGYLIYLSSLAGPTNLMHYDPASFMNTAIGYLMALPVSAAAFLLLFPPGMPWLRRRLLAGLRRQAVLACRAPLAGLRTRFESGTQDLISQVRPDAAVEVDVGQNALLWMLSVLEVGHAVIDLREAFVMRQEVVPSDWRRSIERVLDTVTALFDRPNQARFTAALHTIDDALVTVGIPSISDYKESTFVNQLFLIRGALLDKKSPFSKLNA